ncbi:electron transport complex subunit RsxG [Arenimonas donghaensis]|uniref:Ion-translocating oxidoreductase complex subunit G n=1 Tax=Arenimonas donghaensis DSM 18148 = HO3-R19 TaxID=1121014 RepID=A0A087MF41_9GAMM|nr:electron transport complex subunit RsxG [Arenimonas donghaensis]KFL35494.1 hypothetical protein N788_08435 [Arenimonas donghaensis DSM 18148 = HO3-R19]
MKPSLRESLRASGQLALAGLAAAALLAGTWALTRDRIADSERQANLQALQIVLPADRYDNDPIAAGVTVQAPGWLGQASSKVHRACLGGESAALVLEATAPDGYAGPIRLLVAVDREGRVLGVRITAHQETPGLGDDIEAGRSDWIHGFRSRALGDPAREHWRVRRDGGHFPQFAGATLTPRAVVAAVRRSLDFVAAHGNAVRAAEAGATLVFTDAPTDPPPAR